MDSSSGSRRPDVQRKRPRERLRKHKAHDDAVDEIILAVQHLNAGTSSHWRNKSARETEQCMYRANSTPRTGEQSEVEQLMEQLLIVRDQKRRLESTAGQHPVCPFTGDMEQLLSYLQDAAEQEHVLAARLEGLGHSSPQVHARQASAYDAANALQASTLQNEHERAELRVRKETLEQQLARLAVHPPPGDGAQHHKRCCTGLRAPRAGPHARRPAPLRLDSSGFASARSTADPPLPGRDLVLQEAHAALKASDDCLLQRGAADYLRSGDSHRTDSTDPECCRSEDGNAPMVAGTGADTARYWDDSCRA